MRALKDIFIIGCLTEAKHLITGITRCSSLLCYLDKAWA